jgi:exosortase A
MKRDVDQAIERPASWTTWRRAPVLAAVLAVAGILGVYTETVASIVAIWVRSDTFAHGFVVAPISLWLMWRRRDALALIPATPWWPGLVVIAGAGALWLVTSAGDVLGLRQFAVAFMVIAAVVTVTGVAVGRALVFPLAFLLFAVPAGEFMVPTLVDWTADFTVAALRASGVPIYREANHFMIPSGAWSVVEACSGIRYLIASVMVGTLYAAIAYRSARRRALFVVASILVPIVANWLRAYMIVMIGHLSNNRLAVGVDHLIYGWLFFGVVMLLLFWVGSFWQESPAPAAAIADANLRAFAPGIASAPDRSIYAAAIAAFVVAAAWQPLAAGFHRPAPASAPVLSAIPAAGPWATASGFVGWKPHYSGYAAELHQAFRDGDRDVGLYIAYYRQQERGRELITSGNLLTAREDFRWKQVVVGDDSVDWVGRNVQVDRAELQGPATRLQVFRWYWIGGQVTSSPYVAKALQAWSRLAGHGDDAALIVVYASADVRAGAGRDALRDFSQRMSPAIERMLESARESGK